MEEDNEAKVSNRLKEIIANEQNVNSPSTTPSKKKGGRLALKPQLENIDENAIINSPVPAVTATKINLEEEKPVTPLRRSTRARSNTSLNADTPKAVESPKPKRVTRKNSVAESDNDAAPTPPPAARRTRKTSSTNVDTSEPQKPVEEERAMTPGRRSLRPRKNSNYLEMSLGYESPRAKRVSRRNSLAGSDTETAVTPVKTTRRTRKDSASGAENTAEVAPSTLTLAMNDTIVEEPEHLTANISPSSNNENISPNSLRKSTRLANKSANNSLTTDGQVTPNSNNKRSKKSLSKSPLIQEANKEEKSEPTSVTESTEEFKKTIKKSWATLISTSLIEKRVPTESATANRSLNDALLKNGSGDTVQSKKESIKLNSSVTSKLNLLENDILSQESPKNLVIEVILEDSSSDTGSLGKNRELVNALLDSGDQCVPVVPNDVMDGINKEIETEAHNDVPMFKTVSHNDSCEPMEIDETLPENKTLANISVSETTVNKSQNVSKQDNDIEKSKEKSVNESLSRSKRKSLSQSQSPRQMDKSTDENKSTLILSQSKDDSQKDKSHSKSPKVGKDKSVLEQSTTDKNKSNTVTPLKNKNVGKFGMKTSTPVVTLSLQSNGQNKNKSNTTMDDSSDSEEEPSRNLMIDDEAEEAEDYESGDSLDEEDRKYEEENEIIEKGETLTSDDEVSNDTDYEKDSFVVSSAEEDDDLLEGTGDDLSMSDNELTMSAKSKKKYDERKKKEQKEASREMYEARHNIKGKSKAKKLDSDSESEEEVIVKQKKKLRLDSTTDEVSLNVSQKANKKNRLRLESTNDDITAKNMGNESVSKEKEVPKLNDTNENEITAICDESMTSKTDPLKTDFKIEPKTPQKEFDMSTVNISVRLPIDEVNVNEDTTMTKVNETTDPLSVEDDDDASLSSENPEIQENYESVLENLNKETKKQIKENDTSLNLNKKPKNKVENKILDQLNITATKPSKKKQQKQTVDDSSESLDIQLLFSEGDSTDSTDLQMKAKKDDDIETEDFIPLNKSVAKTNIHEELENLNTSKNQNIKQSDASNEADTVDCSIIMTPGTVKKKKKLSVSFSETVEDSTNAGSIKKKNKKGLNTTVEVEDNSTPVSSKKNKNTELDDTSMIVDTDSSHTKEIESTPVSTKKHRKNSKSGDESIDIDSSFSTKKNKEKDYSAQESSKTTPGSTKKRKNSKSFDEIEMTETATEENVLHVTPASTKKNRKHSESVDESNTDVESSSKKKKKKSLDVTAENTVVTETPISSKKNKSHSESVDESGNTDVESSSKKKKKNKSLNTTVETVVIDPVAETPISEPVDESVNTDVESSSKKKKKNKSLNTTVETEVVDPILTETPISAKKNRKNSESVDESGNTDIDASSKKKKKNKSLNTTVESVVVDPILTETPISAKKNRKNSESVDESGNTDIESSSKKKKKNKAADSTEEVTLTEAPFSAIEDVETSFSKKKNKKNSESVDESHTDVESSSKKKKKNKKAVENVPEIVVLEPTDTETNTEVKQTSTKKRKRNMDQDEANILEESQTSQSSHKKKKQKLAVDEDTRLPEVQVSEDSEAPTEVKNKKKHKKQNKDNKDGELVVEPTEVGAEENIPKRKKRKNIDNDDQDAPTEIANEGSTSKKSKAIESVPRLPTDILDKLVEKPKIKKAKIVSTSNFEIEEPVRRKNKPSHYLEDSVYLNDDTPKAIKKKSKLNNPKVLPFVPTASTSSFGFTTKFQVNTLPGQPKFIAQTNDVPSFKSDYLNRNKKIKKLGTYDLYKKQRSVKLTKF